MSSSSASLLFGTAGGGCERLSLKRTSILLAGVDAVEKEVDEFRSIVDMAAIV